MDGENDVEHMWEQVKMAMVEGAREVCDLMRVEEKNQRSVWWNDEVKVAVTRKEVLEASDEETKERRIEVYRE